MDTTEAGISNEPLERRRVALILDCFRGYGPPVLEPQLDERVDGLPTVTAVLCEEAGINDAGLLKYRCDSRLPPFIDLVAMSAGVVNNALHVTLT
jgi:hypothetical protein